MRAARLPAHESSGSALLLVAGVIQDLCSDDLMRALPRRGLDADERPR